VVANAIRVLLLGANLPIKLWLHAFHFWLRIDNSLASRDQLVSPNYIANGKKVFGKDDAISMLHQLYDERAENLELELAIERKLSSTEAWHAVAEHNIMEPSAIPDADRHHQLTLAHLSN